LRSPSGPAVWKKKSSEISLLSCTPRRWRAAQVVAFWANSRSSGSSGCHDAWAATSTRAWPRAVTSAAPEGANPVPPGEPGVPFPAPPPRACHRPRPVRLCAPEPPAAAMLGSPFSKRNRVFAYDSWKIATRLCSGSPLVMVIFGDERRASWSAVTKHVRWAANARSWGTTQGEASVQRFASPCTTRVSEPSGSHALARAEVFPSQ
jgi:hypothetical protein